jgi:GNAT superfamily N-acetyltransferase
VRPRRAEPDDLGGIARCVERAYIRYVERIGRRPAPMDDRYAERIASGQVHVLDDGGVIGVLVLVGERDHLLLDNVAVAPERQGEGLGRLLIAFAEEEAARRALAELRLYTNAAMTENLALYPRLGWSETGRRTEQGFRRVSFRKTISSPAVSAHRPAPPGR